MKGAALGSGAHGTVYRGVCNSNGVVVALKEIRFGRTTTPAPALKSPQPGTVETAEWRPAPDPTETTVLYDDSAPGSVYASGHFASAAVPVSLSSTADTVRVHGNSAVWHGAVGDADGGGVTATRTESAVWGDSLGEVGDSEAAIAEEINMLRRLRHDNIVSYYGCRLDRGRGVATIVMEYVPKTLRGIAEELIEAKGRAAGGGSGGTAAGLPEKLIAHYARQMLLGIEYLHRHHIVHRDIKCANVLVSDAGVVKVSDFGTAIIASGSTFDAATGGEATAAKPMVVQGTPAFLAPEVLQGCLPLEPSDIWSFGCCLIELATGMFPWQAERLTSLEQIVFSFVTRARGPQLPPVRSYSDTFRDFFNACVQMDPCARPTAAQLLKHEFLAGATVAATLGHRRSLSGSSSASPGSSVALPSGGSFTLAGAASFGSPDHLPPMPAVGEGGDSVLSKPK